MLKRTLYSKILESIENKPITLITGARQVGKTTLCKQLVKDKKYNYVSLDNILERKTALEDPKLFLQMHPYPLIIDEVQYAPSLFDVLEEIVNDVKFKNMNNNGMYVLTGSQSYNLMEGVSQTLSGRVSIINVSPLSVSEIYKKEEIPFSVDIVNNTKHSKRYSIDIKKLFELIVKGMYPELYDNESLDYNSFYSDYVSTYIERDVSQIINITDKLRFQNFLELLASLTGEELVYESIAKSIGISAVTIKKWISVLVTGEIITLLEPYNELSITKRIVKRPKVIFNDTGLACYLARLNNAEVLSKSRFSGQFVETFIINEIIKTYKNNRINANFYYYRDNNQNEIDLIIQNEGRLQLIECKSGTNYNNSDVSSFKCLSKSKYLINQNAIICNTDTPYKISDNCFVLPISSI